MSNKYTFTDGMKSISGMPGPGYEETCRKMLSSGLEWLDNNPEWKPKEGRDDLYSAICESVEDCTFAMGQHVLSHVFWIHKNGWEAYQEEMKQ